MTMELTSVARVEVTKVPTPSTGADTKPADSKADG